MMVALVFWAALALIFAVLAGASFVAFELWQVFGYVARWAYLQGFADDTLTGVARERALRLRNCFFGALVLALAVLSAGAVLGVIAGGLP